MNMNYAGQTETTCKPVFFLKPETALLRNNLPFYCPDFTGSLCCAAGLTLRIGKMGRSIREQFAARYISEIGIGVDLTAKDILDECRARDLPWDAAKSFDCSMPVSPQFIPAGDFADTGNINFRIELDGSAIQCGNSSGLILPFNRIIAYVSQFITLKTGDLIFTGTPDEPQSVKTGCNLKGYIEDRLMLDFDIK